MDLFLSGYLSTIFLVIEINDFLMNKSEKDALYLLEKNPILLMKL